MSASSGVLAGRVVVITGAARGIGEAAARAVAASGGRLVLLDVDGAALSRVSEACGPSVVLATAIDVSDAGALAEVSQGLLARDIEVNVLVNNAAIYAQGALMELPPGAFERVVEVNLLAMLRCCRAFLPHLTRRPGSQIINVLSEFAWLPFPNKGAYCATKAAAAMASACLRTELAASGVRVTDFIPPAVDTGLVRDASTLDPALVAREAEVVRRHAVPAERVGAAIERAIRRPRDRVVYGATQRLAIVAARWTPGLARRAAASMARRMGLTRA